VPPKVARAGSIRGFPRFLARRALDVYTVPDLLLTGVVSRSTLQSALSSHRLNQMRYVPAR